MHNYFFFIQISTIRYTTYCKPEYDFPSQVDVIERTVELVKEFVSNNPATVVIVGAYNVICKESIFMAIADGLDSKLDGEVLRRLL